MVSYNDELHTFSRSTAVLILVVVNNGLVLYQTWKKAFYKMGLNPYCSGRWSRTTNNGSVSIRFTVLILVVMDDGLKPNINGTISISIVS